MPGVGSTTPKMLVVTDAPGQHDDRKGMVLIGETGRLFDQALSECGVKREDVYITHSVKCGWPGENKAPGKKELKFCEVFLTEEIKRLKPNVVVVMGATAFQMVLDRTGLLKIKNHVLTTEKYGFLQKVVPILSPGYVLKNVDSLKDFKKGIKLAVSESQTKDVVKAQSLVTKNLVANTKEKVEKALSKLMKVEEFAFDIETTGLNFLTEQILCIQFSWEAGLAIVIPWEMFDDQDLKEKLKLLMKSKQLKIGQNLKFDVHHLWQHGVRVRGPFFDTMVAHSLVDDNAPDHKLETLVLAYTDVGEYWNDLEVFKNDYIKKHGIKEKEFNYGHLPKDILYSYAGYDADVTFRIKQILQKKMIKDNQFNFFNKYSMPFLPVLVEMEHGGVRMDREKVAVLIKEHEEKLKAGTEKVMTDATVKKFELYKANLKKKKLNIEYEENWKKSATLQSRFPAVENYLESRFEGKELSHKFNMESSPQMKELFFDMLRIKPIKISKKTKQPSTDKEVLNILAEEHHIEVAKLINETRKIAKFLSTFLIPAYEKSELDGRIHTNYHQQSTKTGRLSSSDPNLQNLPRDEKVFKSCFLADPGYVFVKGDLAQAEFRVWAHYSNDLDMINDIKNGLDIHRRTASEVFLVKPEDVTDDQRTVAKRGTFGMIYGIGAKTFASRFKVSIQQAEAINEIFKSRYPVAARWLDKITDFARAHGYVDSWFGRRRRLPQIFSDDHNMVAQAERQSVNSPVQSLASDINNHIMTCTYKKLKRLKRDFKPTLTTHDENVIAVRIGFEKETIEIMKTVLVEDIPGFRCPLQIDFKVGETVGTAKPWEN